MSSLQNRIQFGDAVLSRLDAAPFPAVKTERETFRERHEALLAVQRATVDAVGDANDPPNALLHAWDVALRRLSDRVRGEDAGAVPRIFAAPGSGTMTKPAVESSAENKKKGAPPRRSRGEAKKEVASSAEPARRAAKERPAAARTGEEKEKANAGDGREKVGSRSRRAATVAPSAKKGSSQRRRGGETTKATPARNRGDDAVRAKKPRSKRAGASAR